MKNSIKKILSVMLVAIFIVTVFSVCGVSAAAATPKVYMRYPGGKEKAFTLAFDDSLINNSTLIDVFKENNLKSTFYLNTGNFDKGSTLLTESEAIELFKNSGMEVASHTVHHKDLPTVYKEQGEAGLKAEILDDISKLESMFGTEIHGIAYPGAPPYEFQSTEVLNFLKKNNVGYARVVESSNESQNFRLPKDWLLWSPTCQINAANLGSYTTKFIDKKVFSDPLLFYVWGHAYDISNMQPGFMLGAFCERISGLEDVWYATNGEVYTYVKDYEKLQISADKDTITNPTKRSLFISCGLKDYEIKAGQTVKGILSGTYVEPSKDTESKTSPSSSKKANTASKDKASKVDKTSSQEVSSENDAMKEINEILPGLEKVETVNAYYQGKIIDSSGNTSVYVPNLADDTSQLLDEVLLKQLINAVTSAKDSSVNKIIIYYIDISDKATLEKLINDNSDINAPVELMSLNRLLDNEDASVNADDDNDIMQYLWILIAVAAVVVIALLVVIFLPKFKKSPKE